VHLHNFGDSTDYVDDATPQIECLSNINNSCDLNFHKTWISEHYAELILPEVEPSAPLQCDPTAYGA